nr:uncharacterized protein LOC109154451 [Ipomoea trifida]GLL22632.1 uncharacterized protein LOC109154451 [Ipomoea trifida]
MYQGNNQQREEPPKESMEDKMVRMFSELRHDVTNMRQEWKQDLRQEISTIRQEVSNLRQENNASLRNLETQVAQNSKALAERSQGTLPSTTVNNPRERVQAVTLRSGKELPEPTLKKNTVSKNPIEEEKIEEIIEVDKEQEKETSSLPSSPKATQSRDKGKEKGHNGPDERPARAQSLGSKAFRPRPEGRKSDARPARVRQKAVQVQSSQRGRIRAHSPGFRPPFTERRGNSDAERAHSPGFRPPIAERGGKVGRQADARVRHASDATANPEKRKLIADALRTRVRAASDGPTQGDSADENEI